MKSPLHIALLSVAVVFTSQSLAIAESGEVEPTRSPVLSHRPVPGKLTSPFGWRNDPVKRRRRRRKVRKEHKGIDFAGRRGTPVHSAGAGIVIRAAMSRSYGRIVIVDHGDGLQTRYAHMQRLKVKRGAHIPAGAVVGTIGSSGRATGPHLHFEVRKDGIALPPSDIVNFSLPECKKNARDCKRPATRGKRNNS